MGTVSQRARDAAAEYTSRDFPDEINALAKIIERYGASLIPDREAVAQCIIGPRNAVPKNCPYSLNELREHRWKAATQSERDDALWASDAIRALFGRVETASSGVDAIAAERQRQIEKEGWTLEHDDEHNNDDLIQAAACYLLEQMRFGALIPWPWENGWFKPKDRRSDLVRAGALIAAEIDRLDRLSTIREG